MVAAILLSACGTKTVEKTVEVTRLVPAEGEKVVETVVVEVTREVPAAAAPTGTRLQTILDRGKLICGVNGGLPGFSFLDEATGQFTGFDADYCRAVAAALFDDPNAVEFRPLSAKERSTALQSGEIDVLIRNTTWTSSRDASWGNFGPTIFYDGQGMMVRKDLGVTKLEDLAGASICVQTGTTTELNLTDKMRELGVDFTPVVFEDIDSTYAAYEEGRCDAVTSDRSQLAARRTTMKNPDDHVILDVVMSKEPLGPVVPHGDDQWFDVVKWVVFATIQAEEFGITSQNIDQFMNSDKPEIRRFLGLEGDLGQQLGLSNDFTVRIIRHVGNYAEIFDRNLTPLGLGRGVNTLWTEGGLLYSPPFR
ncbi:MAG: amino acid ABC transporter substrate-binding protein [Chloroflexi bacterium]|nr:MAG: amino acid ABC transporter substrate-binding protein [Chloroflexota bacterium]